MPGNDLPLLIDAARAAGEIATRYWRQHPKTWEKPGHQGPVSEADIAVDEMLCEMLLSARPDYGWLSEETDDDPARLGTRRVFIVDPIDGTRAYLGGERTFAHSLAVVEDGRAVAGVVYLPQHDKLYCATEGGGAKLNDVPLTASPRRKLDGADVLIARPALEPRHWADEVPEVKRHLRPSLAYRLCLVAEGRFDAMVTLRDSWNWDIAAGALIVSEAGGKLSDRRGKPLSFNLPHPVSTGVIAAGNPVLHADLIGRLA